MFKVINLVLACVAVAPLVEAAEGTTRLWYERPAQVWTEALPVGNGSLGAMVFGGVSEERLQVNEDTLWTGRPHEYHRPDAVEVLPELRRLLREGRQKEAETLAMERFMSEPLRQQMYQPFCDVTLSFADQQEVEEYSRELDLDTAIVTVRYRHEGAAFTRETFASHPDRVLVQRIAGDRPGRVNLTLRLTSPHEEFEVAEEGDGGLLLTGRVRGGGMPFAANLRIVPQRGRLSFRDGSWVVEQADAVTILLAGATAFVAFDDVSGDPVARVRETLGRVQPGAYATLRAAHVADHQAFFRRVSLDLGTSEVAALPTDQRLASRDKRGDPALAALLFNYGRYLLIASSRPGSQPANLQGIWNQELNPPWGSKYTTNINFEMNYWPAEVANLAECAEPFFALVDDVVKTGGNTARAHYGARGWVLHHNTDLWRGTAPINHSNHGIWPTGGAWLCLQLWERYRFSGDREFLAQRAYPVFKEAALFFVDTLVEDERNGWLISGPSNSPEHGGLVLGPTMDHQIIRGLFEWTAAAARILGVDRNFAAQLDGLRARLAPNQIGRHGQLQEWLEDKDDPNNRHRHVSHLWGVFPGEDITWRTPELMQAARQSLLHRGDGGTGWALGWKIALWARLLDGDHAHRILMNQLNLVRDQPGAARQSEGGGTYPNLFDAHPPFQIDGNFAATAGVIEMLLQSHPIHEADGIADLVLLPALPSAWPEGSISGIRARGGIRVDLAWKDGRLHHVALTSEAGGPVRLRYGERVIRRELTAGRTATFDGQLTPR